MGFRIMATHRDAALWLAAHEDHKVRVFAGLGAHALIRTGASPAGYL
jgi:hypothetical protein